MMGRTHKVIGACAGISCAVYLSGGSGVNIILISAGTLAGAMGALLPDIDHKGSTVGLRFGVVSSLVSMVCSHRGFTHSLLSVYLLYHGVKMLPSWQVVGFCFIAGYASHIIADMFTKGGVSLFWPVKAKVGIPMIKSGGSGEYIIATIFSIIMLLLPFYKNIDQFRLSLVGLF